jgi:tRNA-uridine 2-sulfurtransferase
MVNAKKRVVVGMSGGVDSSVAAGLLLRQGYEVIGVTLKMWPQDCGSIIEDKCCGPQAMADARSVAAKLGIPHYVIDETEGFTKQVIDYFTSEYQSGRTPNPCVLCNEKLKFGNLMNKAFGFGASHIATGHYARVVQDGEGFRLKRAVHLKKDQSYFLFTLGQQQLAHALMPIGEMTKEEVRQVAKDLELQVFDKEESQDICFVPENDYATFLKTHLGQTEFHPGEIVHRDGRVLGKHQGIELFTVGQRKGINVGHPKPLYVLEIDPSTRRVIVGDDDELWYDCYRVERACWGKDGAVAPGTRAMVKIRHSHDGAFARLYPEDQGRVRVELEEPQRAITPGQASVFYDGDVVIGGGWILREHPIRSQALQTAAQ